MDGSKPWSTTIALGQKILEELKLDRQMDTLARWMAHYLAEKIEKAELAPEGEVGEAARRECMELILKLWERRHSWPLSAPLKDISGRLDELLNQKPKFFFRSETISDPILDLMHNLEDLHAKEMQICMMSYIASLDLEKDREYLKDHAEHLDDDERNIIQRLVNLHDFVLGPEAHLGDEACPSFGTLSKSEQDKLIKSRLQAIDKDRAKLLKKI